MADLLNDGASERSDEREQARLTAEAIWEFLAPSYGPGGGHKLIDDALLRGSAALRDLPVQEEATAPYRRLVTQMTVLGDQATASALLAAGTVARLAGLPRRRIRQALDGVAIARRQSLALLQAAAQPGDVDTLLAAATGLPAGLASHLGHLVVDGHADLDRVDVRATDVDATGWSNGLIVPLASRERQARRVRIAILDEISLKARSDIRLRLTTTLATDDVAIEAARAAVRRHGIGLLILRKSIPEDLKERLLQDGVAIITDAPRSLVEQLGLSTGAKATHGLVTLEADDIGDGHIEPRHPRRGDWCITGDGPSATIQVPQGPDEALRIDASQRWLRLAATAQSDARQLQGGGHWLRETAAGLRKVADLAPGGSPMGIDAVARTMDAMADALVRNTGHDPIAQRTLAARPDSYAAVKAALESAFEAATLILRIDGRYTKRPSAAADMRGGLGPSGSPKGMPGDIPPLM